jgi:hypothetical protein
MDAEHSSAANFEVPISVAASSSWEFQIQSCTRNNKLLELL